MSTSSITADFRAVNSQTASVIRVRNAADSADVFTVSATGNVTAAGSVTVVGINNTSGGITNTGAISGATTIGLNGAISGGTTYSGSGNINTTGGAIQTNTVTRIDNSGNLVAIGNITAAAALQLSTSSNGNITVDANGSGTFTVQDAATFNSTLALNGDVTIDTAKKFAIKATTFATGGTLNAAAFTGSLIRMTGSAPILNGISAGTAADDGRQVTLVNVTGGTILINDNSGSASNGNKILTGRTAAITLPIDASVELVYDWSGSAATSYWRVTSDVADGDCSTTCALRDLSNLSSTNINAALNRTAGTLELQTTTSGDITLNTLSNGSGLINVLTGNLKVGDAAPNKATLNGEDAYIEGTLEVDGIAYFDSGVTVVGNSTITGTLTGLTGLTVASGGATITTGGLTVSAGGASISGGLTVGGGAVALNGNTTIGATYNFNIANSGNYSTITGTDVALTGTLFRMTGASQQTLNSIVAGTAASDGRRITMINSSGFDALINNNGAGTNGNKILTGTGLTAAIPNGSTTELIYEWTGSAATSFWHVNGGVAGGTCATCANQQLNNLSGTIAINQSLTPGANNSIDLGAGSFTWRTLYAGTSVLAPAIDTAAAGTLNIGTATATAINIGNTGSTDTDIIVGNSGNTGSTTRVQGGAFNANFANTGVTFASTTASTAAFVLQNTSNASVFNLDTSTGGGTTIRIGTVADNVTLSSTSTRPYELTLNGTARHQKKVLLTAEYSGAVLDVGGCSNNNGIMTSGLDTVGAPRTNYYDWSSSISPSTFHCYEVVAQVPIPSDWAAWDTDPIEIRARAKTSAADTDVAVAVYDSAGVVVTNFNFSTPLAETTSWADITSSTVFGGSPTFTAGDYITVKVRMSARNSDSLRLGNLTLNYLSKY